MDRPIMLYSWTGKPYAAKSKHNDLTAVVVTKTSPITIYKGPDGAMIYYVHSDSFRLTRQLWETEGFECRAAMDEWFSQALGKKTQETMHIMQFKLYEHDPNTDNANATN
jgi:hypothetical protein